MRLSKFRDKKWILVIVCIINIAIIMARRSITDITLGSGDVIPASGINGTITVFVFLLGIITIFIDYNLGMLIPVLSLFASSMGALMDIVGSHNYSSLPGVISSLFYMVAIYVIGKQLELNDKYNITDHVTGLTNRYGFENELKKRHVLKGNYIVYIHLTGMGKINTNMGRSYFDDCMRIIAERIKHVLGKGGRCFKLEGVDYAIIIPQGCDYIGVVNQVLDSIEDKLELQKNNVTVNCYIKAVAGVVNCCGEDAEDNYKEIMRYADIAMHKSIRANGNRICEFSNEIRYQIERENEIEHIIKNALADKTFYLEYQPQYLINTGNLRGYEALIRLKLSDGTMISPGEFIAVAERSDLIIDIDKYVIKLALSQFVDAFLNREQDVVLSINVSAKDIASPDFTGYVRQALDETGFPADCLEIEITEYSLAESLQNTLNNIDTLRTWGVKIALDDFGTGYTSLAQLLNLPIDLLKIDKSLIDNVESSNQNRDFISSVIYMGHLMDCEVISEGVESEEQLDILKWLECDFVQGFVKNRPLPYEKAVELIK